MITLIQISTKELMNLATEYAEPRSILEAAIKRGVEDELVERNEALQTGDCAAVYRRAKYNTESAIQSA